MVTLGQQTNVLCAINTPETSDTKLPWVLWDICCLKTESVMWIIIRADKSVHKPTTLLCERWWGLRTSVVRNIGTARHAPPVVLLSSLRTQPPFTSVTPLIKGRGPSVRQSATQHVYKGSVYPFPSRLITRKGLNQWKGCVYHRRLCDSVNMTSLCKHTAFSCNSIIIKSIIRVCIGEFNPSYALCGIWAWSIACQAIFKLLSRSLMRWLSSLSDTLRFQRMTSVAAGLNKHARNGVHSDWSSESKS